MRAIHNKYLIQKASYHHHHPPPTPTPLSPSYNIWHVFRVSLYYFMVCTRYAIYLRFYQTKRFYPFLWIIVCRFCVILISISNIQVLISLLYNNNSMCYIVHTKMVHHHVQNLLCECVPIFRLIFYNKLTKYI